RTYRRIVSFAIQHRYAVLAGSLVVLVAGGFSATRLRSSFFPKDLSYLSYVDITLPEDSSIDATRAVAADAGKIVQEVAERYGREHGTADASGHTLRALTTFIGGGAPRFWYSLAPQQEAPNYAQIVVEVFDSRDTTKIIPELQRELSARIPGAYIDVQQLE